MSDMFQDEVKVNDRTELFFNRSSSTFLSSQEKFLINLPKCLKTLCIRYHVNKDVDSMILELSSFDNFNPELLSCAYFLEKGYIVDVHEAFNTCFEKHALDEKSVSRNVFRYLRHLRKKTFDDLSVGETRQSAISSVDEMKIPRRYLQSKKRISRLFVQEKTIKEFVEVQHAKICVSFGKHKLKGILISPSFDGENDTFYDIVCIGKDRNRVIVFLTNFLNFMMVVKISDGRFFVLPEFHEDEFVIVFANMGTFSNRPSVRLFVLKQFDCESHPEPNLLFKQGKQKIETNIPTFNVDRFSSRIDEKHFEANEVNFEQMLKAIHIPHLGMKNHVISLFEDFQNMFSENAKRLNASNAMQIKDILINELKTLHDAAKANESQLPKLHIQTENEDRLFELIQQ